LIGAIAIDLRVSCYPLLCIPISCRPSTSTFFPYTTLFRSLFASLGHTVSIFDNFHGGKAVATSAGILLAYNPLLFVVACLIFIRSQEHTSGLQSRFALVCRLLLEK